MPEIATVLMDDQPGWRWDAFAAGLKVCGYKALKYQQPSPTGVLVTWNRWHRNDRVAAEYEKFGFPVIVAENGYIGKDSQGRQLYALARTHHLGAGRWFVGEEDRWSGLDIEVKPWRSDGAHIVLLPQRGYGPPGIAMPKNWVADVSIRLSRITKRRVVVRDHPGAGRPSMNRDLQGCWAAVTWGSGAGVKAIVAGTPVFHELPNWIGAPAARYGIDQIEDPALCDRAPMLHRLSHAQWGTDEIATGESFRRLLSI